MAKIRLISPLVFVMLILTGTHCLHQTGSTETIIISSDQNKDLDLPTPRMGILVELRTIPVDGKMTTDPPSKCAGYQPDVMNIHNFQVFAFGAWMTQTCHFGLIWNQIKCQCDWKPGIITELEESSKSKCDLTLNITFDGGIVRDYAKNTFIQIDPLVVIKTNSREDQSDVNSGYFTSDRLTIHFFAGNSYSDMFQLRINFKQDEKALNSFQEVILVTNACLIGQNIADATIALWINATRQELSFLINGYVETVNLNTASNLWHSLEISFVKGAVHIIDNDHQILNSTAYPAYVDHSQCPLSIGGDPTDVMKTFHGYFDSILLWRHCRANPERNDDTTKD